jgi:hypothetical protein
VPGIRRGDATKLDPESMSVLDSGDGRDDDGGGHVAVPGRLARVYAIGGNFRRDGGVAGGRGDLWSDVVFGERKDARIRDSPGTGRAARGHSAIGGEIDVEADVPGYCNRRGIGNGSDAADFDVFVWSEADRPVDVRGGSCVFGCDCGGSMLFTGAQGGAGGSAGGVAVRVKKGQAKLNRVSHERLSAQGRKLWVWFAKSSCNTLKGFFGVGLHADSSIRENSRTIMARIVAEKSESSFSQVIHSAGVRRFGEAQVARTENIDQSTEEMSERHDHSATPFEPWPPAF